MSRGGVELAPSPPGVEICSCDEALALRAELGATRARAAAERALAEACADIPIKDLQWWAAHGGGAWRPFARAALALRSPVDERPRAVEHARHEGEGATA